MAAVSAAARNALILGIFAVTTAALLGLTYAATRERIAEAQSAVEAKALLQVVQDLEHDNDILADTLPMPEDAAAKLNIEADQVVHLVRQEGEVVAFILPAVAPDGYSGDIDMIVGIKRNGEISGVRVTAHQETPGLGDKVEIKKSDWITSFNGRSLGNTPESDWAVEKEGGDFDAFTGATITPRAVVNQVHRTLMYYRAHREYFVDRATAERPNEE